MADSMTWEFVAEKLQSRDKSKLYQVTWEAAADGSVTSVASTSDIFGSVVLVVTNPGSTSPTADYDITLTDEEGCDILGAEGVDRSATVSEQVMPKIGSAYLPRFVNSKLTLNIANNSVDSAGGVVLIYVETR